MIRKATANDADAIAAIYDAIHTLEEAGEVTIGWDRAIYPTRATALESIACGDMYVMAGDDNKIVAAARINQVQVPEYADAVWEHDAPDDQVFVLHTLVVDPSESGKGYGTKFVAYYEKLALENNCRFLRMDTNERNTNARRLYKKLGYKEPDIVPCVFNGIEGVQLVCLEKKLDPKPFTPVRPSLLATPKVARVGYQGELGSNSLEAAKRIVQGHDLGICDFLGLVSSIHVVESLLAGHCDYGVVAVRNSFAGEVTETVKALEGAPVHLIDRYALAVNHCLFKLPSVPLDDITTVASHPQALAQTRNTRKGILPQAVDEAMPDTAISARWLSQGTLPPTTAVICSKQAGALYNLELIAEGIQDSSTNCTEFVLLKLNY